MNIKLLEKLCNAFGPTGFETEAQQIVKEVGSPFADEILHDRMGSLIFKKVGDPNGPKILLAGHCDEIGFIITEITKDGFLKFHQLGGWWDQTLLTQEVLIKPFNGKEKIVGVIGAAPPHILDPEQRNKVVTKDKMYIDIGCHSKDEVEELGIRVGDPGVPFATFRMVNRKKKISDKEGEKELKDVQIGISKAFDDRIGVFIGLEVLRRLSEENIQHPNTVYVASTTQEEVGLRGAQTTANLVLPDIGFSLDVDISGDVPNTKGIVQKMGTGVCISAGDGSMIPNPRLRKFAVDVAEKNKITYQTSFLKRGGTDAGKIHMSGIGCPSLFIGIATRHIHSHHGMLDLDDVEQAIQLLIAMITKLDQPQTELFTEI